MLEAMQTLPRIMEAVGSLMFSMFFTTLLMQIIIIHNQIDKKHKKLLLVLKVVAAILLIGIISEVSPLSRLFRWL